MPKEEFELLLDNIVPDWIERKELKMMTIKEFRARVDLFKNSVKNEYRIKSLERGSIKANIIEYLRDNIERRVCAWDLQWWFLNFAPFCWYEASARLSELHKAWLIRVVWYKQTKFWNQANVYQITHKWLNLEIK